MMRQRMEQFNFNSMRLLAGVCGLFTIFALTPVVVAQQGAAVQGSKVLAAATAAPASINAAGAVQPAAKPAEEQEAAAPGKPASEGIKVHGHWVLQVKNADGTLGERREFDNSLAGTNSGGQNGAQALVALLSGNAVAGDPGIAFISTPVSPSCFIAGCYMFVTDSTSLLPGFGNGVSYPGGSSGLPYATGLIGTVSFSPSVNWVLSGNYSVPSGLTSIGAVGTYIPLCMNKNQSFLSGFVPQGTYHDRSADIGSNACNLSSTITSSGSSGNELVEVFPLTYTAVPSGPLAVTTGQVITVTVTISFS